jgi:dihydrofolate reductase
VHAWFNEQLRSVDASLYGRRMYELMAGYWPTAADDPGEPPVILEFAAIWRETPKVVFSSKLESVDWNSRLVRGQPADELAALRAQFGGDMDIGGATLASSFIRAGLVDEFGLMIHPVAIGGGTPYWPAGVEVELRLLETRQFNSGVVYLRYEKV